MGICYLYVLPTAYEDILKLGIAKDPFTRALAFQPIAEPELRSIILARQDSTRRRTSV